MPVKHSIPCTAVNCHTIHVCQKVKKAVIFPGELRLLGEIARRRLTLRDLFPFIPAVRHARFQMPLSLYIG